MGLVTIAAEDSGSQVYLLPSTFSNAPGPGVEPGNGGTADLPKTISNQIQLLQSLPLLDYPQHRHTQNGIILKT